MKLRRLTIGIAVCIALCVLAVILNAVMHSMEASMPFPLRMELNDAEFSTDGGASWRPVGDGSELRRQLGDVRIRGHFSHSTNEGWYLNLYLQHMQMEFYVNGEMEDSFGKEFDQIRPEWCADLWVNVALPETTPEDLIEFRFSTLHRFGVYGGAYEKLISNMRVGNPFLIYQWISSQKVVDQNYGQTLMIIGFVLMGIILAAVWMKSPLQKAMLYTALLALGEGLFWTSCASEISHYVNGSIALFNTGRSVSRMLTIFALLACMSEMMTSKGRKAAQWTACASGVISLGFLVLQLIGQTAFCELEWLWQFMQIVCLLSGSVICLHELFTVRCSFWHRMWRLSFLLAYASVMLDICNHYLGFLPEMQVSKYVCGAVALAQSASLLLQLPASYAAIKRAEMLTEELHNSRIVLAMSQIRTHFIFNVLNAISGLCKSEPQLADQELVRFSRYLRNNIDIMQEDRPIPFEKALDHMHNYVDLEQLRFEEKILLDEHYECTDFMIPSLVIQPLVENAIKHGLLPKEEGGVIRVSTRRAGDEVLIEISDDGVGFDTSRKIDSTSVGLSNVRFRVERMMGGRMKVESTPGKGTIVQVWLPFGREEKDCTLSM